LLDSLAARSRAKGIWGLPALQSKTTESSFKPARVLVTGGAGFLGSHVCERLVAAGNEVLCVDNYFTGTRRNIAGVLNHANFEAIRHDITFPLFVEVDQIYNLACPASPIHYQHDPVQTTKTSVHGAINMLGLAKRVGAKILQSSTSEVYGDPHEHPQREDYWGHVNPIGRRSCYDEGKRCAETLFFDYHRQHGLPIKVARIFNTYGPRMHPHDGRVVSNFIFQALTGGDITVYGDGRQTRSFCYCDDLVDGLVRLMTTGDDVTGPINLGNPSEITIRDLAEMILNFTGSRSRIVSSPLPLDDPRQRCPDITKATSLLGWQPKVPLQDGLRETVRYFQHLLDRGAGAF
jgi:UDP-glucuronate decarboxylase